MAAKRYVVLGLGAFGGALARGLSDSGGLVTGVDRNESLVESLRDSLHEAIVGDVTDRAVLETLLLDRAEAVFIKTALTHSGVTHELNGLRDCLFASGLTRRLRSTWFEHKTEARRLDRSVDGGGHVAHSLSPTSAT